MKSRQASVVGVHLVEAEEPVWLIEILVEGSVEEFDFGKVTQSVPKQPKDNWRVAYDEQQIKNSDKGTHFAFFFHYLDLDRPLDSSFGPLALPKPTQVPHHLRHIIYKSP